MPLTPHGQWEMIIGTVVLLIVALLLALLHPLLGLVVLPVLVWLIAFFRDPDREITKDAKSMVSPADGLVSDITRLDEDQLHQDALRAQRPNDCAVPRSGDQRGCVGSGRPPGPAGARRPPRTRAAGMVH